MPICVECKKEVLDNYQTSKTKRNTEVVFCNECVDRMREEAKRARDSKKFI